MATQITRLTPTTTRLSILGVLAISLGLGGCQPEDRQPGFWLSGNAQTEFPADWSFTSDHREVFVEVNTPYFLPHSVTIWCAEVDGSLYIAARDPETKNWPGWVDAEPDVTLKVGEDLYAVHLQPLEDAGSIARVAAAYQGKYQLPSADGVMRYWSVLPPGA
jgi:hypothetical protein